VRRPALALVVALAGCTAPRPPPLPPVVWSELDVAGARASLRPAVAAPATIDALPRGRARGVVSIERLRATWAKAPTYEVLDAFGGQLTGADDPARVPCLGRACKGPPILGPIGTWLYLAFDEGGLVIASLGYEGKSDPVDGIVAAAERSVAAGHTPTAQGIVSTRGRFGDGVGAYMRAPHVVTAVRSAQASAAADALARGAPEAPKLGAGEVARFTGDDVPLSPVSAERLGHGEVTVARADDGTSFDVTGVGDFADHESAARFAADVRANVARLQRGFSRVLLHGLFDHVEVTHVAGSRRVKVALRGSEDQLTTLASMLLRIYGL